MTHDSPLAHFAFYTNVGRRLRLPTDVYGVPQDLNQGTAMPNPRPDGALENTAAQVANNELRHRDGTLGPDLDSVTIIYLA